MPVFVRYLLFQLPSWILVALVLVGLAWKDLLPLWLAWAVVAGLVVKDLVFFPRLRIGYEPSRAHGGGELLGAIAVVDTPLGPEGYVRVGPERWRARLLRAGDRAAPGEAVWVREIERLTLLVEKVAQGTGEDGG